MLATFRRWFADRPIRYKLLLTYSTLFGLCVAVGGGLTYRLVRAAVERSIESELTNSTDTILNLVRTSVSASSRNYLRAVADRSLEIVQRLQERERRGELSGTEARRQAAELLLAQRIGKTGYICCLDSRGVMLVHPSPQLVSRDLSEYAFVRELRAKKRGYFEYEWRNLWEKAPRAKATYMAYFEPWDWIILASAYRDEFNELVNIQDFRESVLGLTFGRSGYAYVFDRDGNILIHPTLEGANVFRRRLLPAAFVGEMLSRPSGRAVYSWQNPGDPAPREKLVVYKHLPEYGWIVACSSYLDEVYAPLRQVRALFLGTAALSLALVLPLTFRISSSITSPLRALMAQLGRGAGGRPGPEPSPTGGDEVAHLSAYFRAFLVQLEEYSASLASESREREQAEKALRLSEEMFSTAFRSSPHGLAILSLEGRRLLDVNETLLGLLGQERDEVLGRTPEELGLPPLPPEFEATLFGGEARETWRGLELELRTKGGGTRLARIGAERVEIWREPCLLVTVEDVTEWRRLEREVIETGDRERRRIGQELHDDLGPHLIGIEVLSKVLGRRLEARPDEAELAAKIRGLITEAIQKTRALARGLCPVHLGTNGLDFALRELAASVTDLYGVACECRGGQGLRVPDDSAATQLFYIAREAVHNAVKHARASRISVELAGEQGRLVLRVVDDGCGIDPTVRGSGLGLRIMEYRARLIGGNLEVRGTAGVGTEILVAAPFEAEEEP